MDTAYLASWEHFTETIVTSTRIRHFLVKNRLDLTGITSVALWSCYLVCIRKGKKSMIANHFAWQNQFYRVLKTITELTEPEAGLTAIWTVAFLKVDGQNLLTKMRI